MAQRGSKHVQSALVRRQEKRCSFPTTSHKLPSYDCNPVGIFIERVALTGAKYTRLRMVFTRYFQLLEKL